MLAIATLRNKVGNGESHLFGGVFVAKKDNKAINSIHDLKGKVIAASSILLMGSGQTQWQEMRRHGLDLLVDAAQVPHYGPNKLRASLRAIQVTALCLGDRSSWSGKINRRSSTPYCRAAPTSGAAPFRPACKADSASRRSLAPLAYRHRLPAHPNSDTGASGGSCRTLHHRPVPLRRATRTHLPCELSNSRPCARAPRPGRLVRTGFVEGTAGRSRRGLLKYVHVLPARADFPLPFSTTVRRPAAAPAMHPDEPTRIRACA